MQGKQQAGIVAALLWAAWTATCVSVGTLPSPFPPSSLPGNISLDPIQGQEQAGIITLSLLRAASCPMGRKEMEMRAEPRACRKVHRIVRIFHLLREEKEQRKAEVPLLVRSISPADAVEDPTPHGVATSIPLRDTTTFPQRASCSRRCCRRRKKRFPRACIPELGTPVDPSTEEPGCRERLPRAGKKLAVDLPLDREFWGRDARFG
ncbi:hypothetical protein BDK51DRAFT_52774 [Blyttiomyces helicus]|uniref:Uncharacterized protein n=1 Tax=Blyttiomyces helicus TaxID=388810 RepID=A0A4P9W4I0_9FUNG|nr:hypothetical protein BDK51DRAFT_52774 [Blyttiomyces helicus]|eukprot:RKO85600.1 hypothetical protein BDK51DRAFT_52774 [Blyttiomyces helicus]